MAGRIMLGVLVVFLAVMAIINLVETSVILNQRATIRLLNETTKPRACSGGGNRG